MHFKIIKIICCYYFLKDNITRYIQIQDLVDTTNCCRQTPSVEPTSSDIVRRNSPSLLGISSDSKEIVADLFAALYLFPTETRHVYHAHDPRAVPPFAQEEALQLVLVNILVPVVRPRRNDVQDILSHQVCREPAHPCPRNGAHDQPAAGLDKRPHSIEERLRLINVLNDFEQRDNIVAQALLGRLEVLNGCLLIGQLVAQGWVLFRMGLGDGQDGRRRVDGGDVFRAGESRGAFGKDAAAAANIEVSQTSLFSTRHSEASADKVVAEGVHEV